MRKYAELTIETAEAAFGLRERHPDGVYRETGQGKPALHNDSDDTAMLRNYIIALDVQRMEAGHYTRILPLDHGSDQHATYALYYHHMLKLYASLPDKTDPVTLEYWCYTMSQMAVLQEKAEDYKEARLIWLRIVDALAKHPRGRESKDYLYYMLHSLRKAAENESKAPTQEGEALRLVEKALDFAREATDADSEPASEPDELYRLYWMKADMLYEAGQAKEAAPLYEQGLPLCELAHGENPSEAVQKRIQKARERKEYTK